MDNEKNKIIKYLNDFIKRAREHINVENFIFFGSRARDHAKKDSDIDILIISRDFEGIKFFKRSPPLYLLWKAPFDIDIICLTPEEFAKKSKEIGIIKQAIKEGIEL